MTQTRLKQLREEAVLTVHELAETSGVSDDTISKIENGQRVARPSTLRKLAHALNVSPQELRRPAEIKELAGAGKTEAPREAGPTEERWPPDLKEWLKEHGATRILMTDEEVIKNLERIVFGADRKAIPNRFAQEARETFKEEASVKDALREEWWHEGNLFPKPEEGPGTAQRNSAQFKKHEQFQKTISRAYGRYDRAIEDRSRMLYFTSQADDFVILNKRPQSVEVVRARTRALQEEAFENEQGA